MPELTAPPPLEHPLPGVTQIPMPIPFEVGPVNAFLVQLEPDAPFLVDTGPRTERAWDALQAGFRAAGIALSDLRAVLVTHAHVDHHGALARVLSEAPDAIAYCHEDAFADVADYTGSLDRSVGSARRLMTFWGIGADASRAAEAFRDMFARYGEDVASERMRGLSGERATLEVGRLRVEAIHVPGHDRGHVVFRVVAPGGARVVFGGDHLLETITPNPTVYDPPYRGRRTGLAHYLTSLERLRPVAADWILPGHGSAYRDLPGRIDQILRHHDERMEKVAERLREGPARVIDLVFHLWPGLAPDQIFLACREAHGHLDLLVDAGRARCETADDGVGRFAQV